jgi:hypothetical protein
MVLNNLGGSGEISQPMTIAEALKYQKTRGYADFFFLHAPSPLDG